MASEEMSFENVDDGRTDACLYYKLTFGSGELKKPVKVDRTFGLIRNPLAK